MLQFGQEAEFNCNSGHWQRQDVHCGDAVEVHGQQGILASDNDCKVRQGTDAATSETLNVLSGQQCAIGILVEQRLEAAH